MTPSVIKIKRMTYGDKKLPERAPSSAFWPGGGRPIAPSPHRQRHGHSGGPGSRKKTNPNQNKKS